MEHAFDLTENIEGHARDALARAVKNYDEAQHHVRESAPAVARVVPGWQTLERFESDGRQYLLACRRRVPRVGFASLTQREHQALAFLAGGVTNKVIAYEMKVSASTVGVLLHRARQKLGAQGRASLVQSFLAHGGTAALAS